MEMGKQAAMEQDHKKQNALNEIANEIKKAKTVLIFSHHSPDGDGLGASVALQLALEKMGKQAFVILEDEVPEFIRFIMTEACRHDYDNCEVPDLCIAVDCADAKRFTKRQKLFFSAPMTINLDHHYSNDLFAQMNYVDGGSAAACEIIFQLIRQWDIPIDQKMAEALYVGIVTDTGQFQYANTNAKTHRVTAQLLDTGVDIVHINKNLFESNSLSRKKLIAKMLDTTELYQNGKISVAHITMQMMEESKAVIGDTEGVVDEIRDIKGVEVSVLFKEIGEKMTRASLRSKSYVDVNEIAVKFGGGGHKRASGCIMHCPVMDAKRILVEELQDLNWNEWNNQFE